MTQNPGYKIGFSSFATLRPKHCVLPAVSGPHNVCVRTVCENTKLMIMRLQNINQEMTNVDYFVRKIVCENAYENCYLNICSKCPDSEIIPELLKTVLEQNLVQEMIYRKWTTTDRAEMKTFKVTAEKFVRKFIICLKKYKVHNFIAKAQSSCLTLQCSRG